MDKFFQFFQKYRQDLDVYEKELYANYRAKHFFAANNIFLEKYDIEHYENNIFTALMKRKSAKLPISPSEKLSRESLSTLLKYSVGLNETEEKRVHPSGGGKYPIMTYILIYDIDGILPGAYYYNPQKHSLIEIFIFDEQEVNKIKNNLHSDYKSAQSVVFLSYSKDRNYLKYGSLAYQAAILEGGHIAQNFFLVGTVIDLQVLCSLTMDFEFIEDLFGLTGTDESMFYSIVLAK